MAGLLSWALGGKPDESAAASPGAEGAAGLDVHNSCDDDLESEVSGWRLPLACKCSGSAGSAPASARGRPGLTDRTAAKGSRDRPRSFRRGCSLAGWNPPGHERRFYLVRCAVRSMHSPARLLPPRALRSSYLRALGKSGTLEWGGSQGSHGTRSITPRKSVP